MNDNLIREFSDKDIGDATFQIGPSKSPGIDGFPARFSQKTWGFSKKKSSMLSKNSSKKETWHLKSMKQSLCSYQK
jgi:hypothetical protein